MASNYRCWNPALSLHSKVSDNTTTVLPWQHSAGAVVSCSAISVRLWSTATTCDPSVPCQSVQWPVPESWTSSDERRWTHQSARLAPLHPWAKQHSTAGFIWHYVTQHHPRRPYSHHPSPPTPPPTSAPLAIYKQRCIVRQECFSTNTTCGDICGGLSFGNI